MRDTFTRCLEAYAETHPELVLVTGGRPSRFLDGLPLQHGEVRPAEPGPQGVQMSLF